MKPKEYVFEIWGLDPNCEYSDFTIPVSTAVSHIESYIEREHVGLHKDHVTVTDQVNILQEALKKLMTGFDSESEKMDFILDVCNEYKKELNFFITQSK